MKLIYYTSLSLLRIYPFKNFLVVSDHDIRRKTCDLTRVLVLHLWQCSRIPRFLHWHWGNTMYKHQWQYCPRCDTWNWLEEIQTTRTYVHDTWDELLLLVIYVVWLYARMISFFCATLLNFIHFVLCQRWPIKDQQSLYLRDGPESIGPDKYAAVTMWSSFRFVKFPFC